MNKKRIKRFLFLFIVSVILLWLIVKPLTIGAIVSMALWAIYNSSKTRKNGK